MERKIKQCDNSAAKGVVYGAIGGLIFWGLALVALYFYLTGGAG